MHDYCRLPVKNDKNTFEYIFNELDESVTNDWVRMVGKYGTSEIERTLDYLQKDIDNDGKWLVKSHNVIWFRSSTTVNADDLDSPAAIPPHRVPGIVIKIKTENDEVQLARIYGNGEAGGWLKGGFLADLDDVENESRTSLIRKYALIDDSLVTDTPSNNHPEWDQYIDDDEDPNVYPWANYQCLSKVYIPEDYPMRISYTSVITQADLSTTWDRGSPNKQSNIWQNRALLGGEVQFQLVGYNIESDDRWVPLGSIKKFNSGDDNGSLMRRWKSASKGDKLGNCSS